jgi:hypothetical protein
VHRSSLVSTCGRKYKSSVETNVTALLLYEFDGSKYIVEAAVRALVGEAVLATI